METLTNKEISKLVERALNGEEDAFSKIYSATSRAQFYMALSILKDKDMAEDAVQSAYLKVMENLGNLSSPRYFISWLNHITYNCCMDIAKNHNRLILSDEQDFLFRNLNIDPDTDPVGRVLSLEKRKVVLEVLNSLTDDQRTIILLRYYNNLKLREIAEIIGCSLGTVKSRLHYSLLSLKRALRFKGYYGTEQLFGIGTLISSSIALADNPLITSQSRSMPKKIVNKKSACMLVCVILASGILTGAGIILSPPDFVHISVSASDKYISEPALIKIKTKGAEPDYVNISYENGEAVTSTEEKPGKYLALAGRNGKLTISLIYRGNCSATEEITLNCIDIQPPVMTKCIRKNNQTLLFLEDNLSGIDYKRISVQKPSGEKVKIISADRQKNIIILPFLDNEQLHLRLYDAAGNYANYRLKPF